MELEGKKIVIIGGSSGIGLATARRAIKEKASVVICSRSEEKLKKAREGLGNQVSTYAVDISSEDDLKRLFEQTGDLDHLFITAGSTSGGLIVKTEMEQARKTMDTRFWGCYNATHFAAGRMRKHGSITFMSGNVTLRPIRGSSVGAASVAAVEAFARSAALELAPIRVNTIRAGLVDTPLLDAFGENRQGIIDGYIKRSPLKRIGSSEDVAAAAIYLMKNEFTTGTVLHIDGGGMLV